MRLLVAGDQWFPDYAGGSARVTREVAERLARRGHELDVVVPASPGQPSLEEPLPGLRVHRALARGRLPQTAADVLGTRAAVRRLAACGARTGPAAFDAVLAHQATTAEGVVRALPGTPLALVFHASARRELAFARGRLTGGPAAARARAQATLLQPALATLERRALRRAAAVLVLSAFSRSLVLEDDPGAAPRVREVGGGVDTARFAPDRDGARARLGIEHGTVQLLTVRRLDARMGLEALLDAFAALRPGRPWLRLAVAGSGPLEGDLHAQAAALGLDDGSVAFLGRISEGELVDRHRAADLFVLPTAAYEGFGLVTAEALACGTPVAGTPAGATPELLAPLSPALVADGTAAADIAGVIRRALPLLCPELRARCREHALARFAWDAVTDRWEEAILAIAAGRAGSARPLSTFGAAPCDFPVANRR